MKHVEKTSILDMLAGYAAKKPMRMHMPGHKADARFCKLFTGAASLDITELAFSDNLDHPTGVIASAENRAAEILGAERSFFLTDGSTSGVFAMLAAVRRRGKKILINRNAHKSVYNACHLLGIEPVILGQNTQRGVALPPPPGELARALERVDGVIGALITYPDYYGNTADLKEYKRQLSAQGKLLLVDGAHGGHFRFDDRLTYAGEHADIWVDGVHKTMPAFSQAAILNVGNADLVRDVERAVCAVRTSSPNYLILASIEYALEYMAAEGAQKIRALRHEFSLARQRMNGKGIAFYPCADALKIIVDCAASELDADGVEAALAEKGVYLEMNDGRYLLFLLSPVMEADVIRKMEKILLRLRKKKTLRKQHVPSAPVETGKRKLPYLVATELERERVPLDRAVGRIAADNAGTFPPCFPVLVAGETITEQVVAVLRAARDTFGVHEGCIDCCK